ncbi:MAG: hypothetical protein V4615_08405 [Bacteroidota bacterium]
MSELKKKQFGIWMDSHYAIIAGKENIDNGNFIILGHAKNPETDSNSNESSSNHQEIALTHKFFKEIAAIMVNVDEVHVTGTGQVQEQFIKYLAQTPQYKNAVSTESTSNKMGEEQFIEFITKHFKGSSVSNADGGSLS